MELAMLEEKAREHERRFDSGEKDVLRQLEKKLREKGNDDEASRVKKLRRDGDEVDDRVWLARKGELSSHDIGKVIAKIDTLTKQRDKLLSRAPYKKEYTKIKERQKEKQSQQEQDQSMKSQLDQEAGASQVNESDVGSFKARRKKQLKVAGHPAARNLMFSSLRLSEHAIHRWRDRGLKSTTLAELLAEIDDARVFYKMESCEGDKGKPQWEVKLQRLEEAKQLVLILDHSKTAIITVLRDDEYDYGQNDGSFAPAGKINAEKASSPSPAFLFEE